MRAAPTGLRWRSLIEHACIPWTKGNNYECARNIPASIVGTVRSERKGKTLWRIDRRECRCIENPYTTKYCNVRRECEWGIREGGQGREAKPIGRSKAEKGSEQTIAPIPIPSPTPQTIHTETRGSQDLGSFWNWVWHRLEAILTSPGQNCGIKIMFLVKLLGVLVLDIAWVKMGSHSLGNILHLVQQVTWGCVCTWWLEVCQCEPYL